VRWLYRAQSKMSGYVALVLALLFIVLGTSLLFGLA
jgi:hypothetical protein